MIEARRLSVSVAGRQVLRTVDLSVQRGELVAVIGPPEAGKSVLLKTLAGLMTCDAGELLGAGEALDSPPRRAKWRAQVGMAFQNDALFDGLSVFDNVAFPLRRRGVAAAEIERRVVARLKDVDLLEARGQLPHELSGGMKKRVGLARATVHEPPLVLLDDPTAGLDPLTSSRIMQLVVSLTTERHTTAIVVSNELAAVVARCQRVLMLLAGQVIFDGAPAGLRRASRPEVVQFATGADAGPL